MIILFFACIFLIIVLLVHIFFRSNIEYTKFYDDVEKLIRTRHEERTKSNTNILFCEIGNDSIDNQRVYFLLQELFSNMGIQIEYLRANDRVGDILSLPYEVIKPLASPKILKELKEEKVEPFVYDLDWNLTQTLNLDKEEQRITQKGLKITNEEERYNFYASMTIKELVEFCLPLIKVKKYQKWLKKNKELMF